MLALLCTVALFPVQAEAKGQEIVLTPLEDEDAPPPPPGQEAPKWHLQADKLVTLSNNTIVEAEGGVVLTRGNDVLKADFARYYSETDWVFLKGNVFVRMGRDDLHSEEAEFDLRSKTGWLTNGNVFMEGQHIYFQGEEIIKHYGDRYTFQQARITTCDGDTPAWSLTADEAVVEIDGYAQLFRSSFQIKNLDVLFSPFMVLPAKTTRQSGFLVPDYGYSTKRGVYYTQPYYWVIDEASDMTFYAGIMTERGFMPGVEYRSHPFSDQKTWFAASGLFDSKTVRTPGDNDVYPNSGRLRTNRDRYWLRGMADGFIGNTGWRYRSNLDYVSDQDYLREFKQGPMGFRRSRQALFEMFGRDIREDDQNRVSQMSVYKDWDRFGVVASLRYEQNPALGHGNATQDTLVQQVPRIDAFLYKGFVFPGKPLEVEAQLTSGYMYRQTGTSGMRTDIYPKASVPLDLGFGTLIGTVGVRQTWYSNTSTSNNSPFAPSLATGGNPRQTSESRTIPEFNVKGFTEASKVWQLEAQNTFSATEPVGSSAWVAMRHQVQPRVNYRYTARVDQERNPFYFDDDRLLPTNEVSLSVTNIFTRKRGIVTPGEEVNGVAGDPTVNYDYLDIVRWRIEGGFDFNESHRNRFLDEFERRPLMDVISDLEFRFTDWLGYTGKTYLSVYDGKVTRQDHGIALSWPGRASWQVGVSTRAKEYDYRRRLRYENRSTVPLISPVNLLYNTFSWNINENWAVGFMDSRNMREGGSAGKAYEQGLSITYSAQCYRFVGQYRYDDYDKSFSIMVELPGLFD